MILLLVRGILVRFYSTFYQWIRHTITLWHLVVLKWRLHPSRSLHVHIVLFKVTAILRSVKFILAKLIIYMGLLIFLTLRRHPQLVIPLWPLELILTKVALVLFLISINVAIIVVSLIASVWIILVRILNFMRRYRTFAINPLSLNNMPLLLFHYLLNWF